MGEDGEGAGEREKRRMTDERTVERTEGKKKRRARNYKKKMQSCISATQENAAGT